MSAPAPARPRPGWPEPVYLALSPEPVLAFIHEPDGPARDTAVLICPPFGWDENCSYRARRRWADELAAAGYPTARFDLPGTGDSGGAPGDDSQLDAWVESVTGTVEWLRERTGCARLAVIGIALGGLVAYLAAAAGAEVDELVLWAVPASGRVLLREMKAFAGVVAARHPADARGGPPLPEGAADVIGYLVTADTTAALGRVRLDELELPRAHGMRVLMLGRDGLAPDKRLRASLEQSGAAVTAGEAGDYARLMAHPQDAQAPDATIARSIEWFAGGSAPARGLVARAARPAVERDRLELERDGRALRETPLELQVADGRALAILTEPVEGARAQVCALLLNGGALRHTGPNRSWVDIARRWAAQGVPSVRVDLSGIGDAEGEERDRVSNRELYAERSNRDTLGLVEQLAVRGVGEQFVLAGLCSGAYWALHAALRDPRVKGALMINLYSFYWSEKLVHERETFEALGALRSQGWRRLVRRDVRPDRLMTAVKSIRPSRIRRGARHQVEFSQRDQVVRDLDLLRDRGTEALLLLSHGEPLYDQLVRQGQLENLDRWPNLRLERIASRDHMFRALWLQQQVHASLDRGLERVLERTGDAGLHAAHPGP